MRGLRLFPAILIVLALFISSCHKKKEAKKPPLTPPVAQKVQNMQQRPRQTSRPANVKTVRISDKFILGDPSSKLVMVEFTDFQCPFCRRFHAQTFPLLKKEYIDTGKLKWVTIPFPLRFHQYAFPAARGFICAGKTGGEKAYWQYYMKIFNVERLNPYSPVEVATEIGLNRGKFSSCMDSEEVRNELAGLLSFASVIGVRGTPTFILGKDNGDGTMTGEMVVGAQPYEIFKDKIDALLSK